QGCDARPGHFLGCPALAGVIILMGPDILGRLIDQHAAALVLYARQWCAAPEDVVQDAFLKLSTQPRLPNDPGAWLFKVVRNSAINAGMAARRRHRHETAAAARSSTWFDANPAGAQRT